MYRETRQACRVLTRESVILMGLEGRLSWTDAARALGITARQLRRVRKAYAGSGRLGLADGRSGGRGPRIAVDKIERLSALKRGMYSDFSVQHFYEEAVKKHGYTGSYSTLLRKLQESGAVEKTKRRGTYRRRRPRQPMVGMRLHTDGSTHAWLGPDHPMWDLVILLDDADGRLLAARFVPEESVASTMMLLEEVLEKHGRFAELYHDRGSMYCRTSDAGVGPDPRQSGQVPRALAALGIKQIWAYSPQARGRCERAFGTIQGRLCAELALHKINDYETADAYLQDVFIPEFNRKFTVEPTEKESVFVPLALDAQELRLILSVQHQRVVKNDYTVQFEKQVLQLPKHKDGRVLCKQKVTLHERHDGQLFVTHQGKLLACFKAEVPWFCLPGFNTHQAQIITTKTPDRVAYQTPKTELDEHLKKTPGPVVQRADLFAPDWR